MLRGLLVLVLLATVKGRAVNISNTWMLPEEGFPVFYRYFRDRISWYEADAVCQFHHANLVTVDTTSQYDAVRAYLKELGISSAVWLGLIRSNPDGEFTWTDYRSLSGEGYWSSVPESTISPLCAAADPAADYRWEARACGGPMVASFICELPVPQWASGVNGCMVKALPALTALYLPESAAVQLTIDCGLAGVRRVECTGKMKREDLLKELSCVDETTTNITNNETDIMITSFDDIQINITDDVLKQTTTDYPIVSTNTIDNKEVKFENKMVLINQGISKYILDDNNQGIYDNPKLLENDNFISEEVSNKLEDERNRQDKMLHEELARIGNSENFERIFTQSSDHFIPPLVMAKSKESEDMTVLSLNEKQAQLAKEHFNLDKFKAPTEDPQIVTSTYNPPTVSIRTKQIKNILPKKYVSIEQLKNKAEIKEIQNSFPKLYLDKKSNKAEEDSSMELTITLIEPKNNVPQHFDTELSTGSPKEATKSNLKITTSTYRPPTILSGTLRSTIDDKNVPETQSIAPKNLATMIPSLSDNYSSDTNASTQILQEITTENIAVTIRNQVVTTPKIILSTEIINGTDAVNVTEHINVTDVRTTLDESAKNSTETVNLHTTKTYHKEISTDIPDKPNSDVTTIAPDRENQTSLAPNSTDASSLETTTINGNITPTIDVHSPLLSGADDATAYRPVRKRKFRSHDNHVVKFNPLRILG